MNKAIPLLIAAFAFGSQAAWAQKPSSDAAVAVVSTAGKAAIVSVEKVSATVVGIEKATRSLTLKGPDGRTVDVIASDVVKNFDQIRIGDHVAAEYQQALTLELRKTRTKSDMTETVTAARAKPGERPAGVIGREVTALADVVGVDPKKSIISLKGPRGNIVDLRVRNRDHFKVVKVGDQVEVVYSEALAIAVTPDKAAGKK